MSLTAAILIGICLGVGLGALGYCIGRLARLDELRAEHERVVSAWLRVADEGERAIVSLQTELALCHRFIREALAEDMQEEAQWTEN